MFGQESLENEEGMRVKLTSEKLFAHPLNGKLLKLEEYLWKLKILYGKIKNIYYKNNLSDK